jgi:hypothetical protein
MKIVPAKLILAACLFLSFQSLNAQLKLPLKNNALKTDLEQVIDDYPKEFATLKGSVQAENPQTVEYNSQLKFSGSESCIITRYTGAKAIYSFQAVMLTTEDFETAVKKYKWLFNQLKGMTVKVNRDYTFSLAGNYESPEESRKFTSSIFHMLPSAVNVPKLKIEVSLQFEFPEWKVNLLVYEKEREDDERGETEEGK